METKKLHFNYDLQVWVRDGKVLDCGHPKCRDLTIMEPRKSFPNNHHQKAFKIGVCNQHKYADDAEYIAVHKWEVSRGKSFPKGA